MEASSIHQLVEKAREQNARRASQRNAGRITREEGLYLQYRLRCREMTCAGIARGLGCERQAVQRVVSGQTRSRRIEGEIARALGYDSWTALLKTIRQSAA